MGRPRPWLSLLALVLGLALVAGEALNQTKLDDNEQAQAEGREEEEAVVSHVVEVADEVELQRYDTHATSVDGAVPRTPPPQGEVMRSGGFCHPCPRVASQSSGTGLFSSP